MRCSLMLQTVFQFLQTIQSILLAGLLFTEGVTFAYGQDITLPGPLVDTDWLQQNLDKVKIFKIRFFRRINTTFL